MVYKISSTGWLIMILPTGKEVPVTKLIESQLAELREIKRLYVIKD